MGRNVEPTPEKTSPTLPTSGAATVTGTGDGTGAGSRRRCRPPSGQPRGRSASDHGCPGAGTAAWCPYRSAQELRGCRPAAEPRPPAPAPPSCRQVPPPRPAPGPAGRLRKPNPPPAAVRGAACLSSSMVGCGHRLRAAAWRRRRPRTRRGVRPGPAWACGPRASPGTIPSPRPAAGPGLHRTRVSVPAGPDQVRGQAQHQADKYAADFSEERSRGV